MTTQEQAKKIKLFQIGAEYEALNELIQESGGEITQVLESFSTEIESLEAVKVDNCVVYLRSIEAQIDGAKALEEEIKKNRQSLERKVENFKKYLLFCLQVMDKPELKGNAFKLKPRQGVYSVHIKDENLVPPMYLEQETKIKINKKAIGESFKTGSLVDGCAWVKGENSLSISSGI